MRHNFDIEGTISGGQDPHADLWLRRPARDTDANLVPLPRMQRDWNGGYAMSESEYRDIYEQLSRDLAKAGELIAKLGGGV